MGLGGSAALGGGGFFFSFPARGGCFFGLISTGSTCTGFFFFGGGGGGGATQNGVGSSCALEAAAERQSAKSSRFTGTPDARSGRSSRRRGDLRPAPRPWRTGCRKARRDRVGDPRPPRRRGHRAPRPRSAFR